MTPKRLRLFLSLLAAVSLTGVVHAQSVVIASNYAEASPAISHAWEKGYWWQQDVAANHGGYITEIGVHMGSNTVPYEAIVVIKVNGNQVFAHGYKNLTQRQTDWATIFPITGTNILVKHGDTITVTIAPNANIMYVPSTTRSRAWSSPTYGPREKQIMRCFINGSVSPLK